MGEMASMRQSCEALRASDAQKTKEVERLAKAISDQSERSRLLEWEKQGDSLLIRDLNRSSQSLKQSSETLQAADAEKAEVIAHLTQRNREQSNLISDLQRMKSRNEQEIANLYEEIKRLKKWSLL